MDEDRVEKVPHSCTQCRRKKAKCDCGQPCSACTKSRLSCSYDKVSRTPLTRKHLTVVERELARAKARLHEYEGRQPSRHGRNESISSVAEVDRTNGPIRPSQSIQTFASPVQSLETPPAGEFDWDERSFGFSHTRNGDGMASLAERNGYIGVTSGTALLRMAREDSGDDQTRAEPA